MLIHSKDILRKLLQNKHTVPNRIFYSSNFKSYNQFARQLQRIKNDKFNNQIPAKREEIITNYMGLLHQLIEKTKRDTKIITICQKQISIFIQCFSRFISDMNYQELAKTMQKLSEISRYYHQFKRQFVSLFFKTLQKRIKELIKSQPQLTMQNVFALMKPFLKVKSATTISKEILYFTTKTVLKITSIDSITEKQLEGYKAIIQLFIPHGIKSTHSMKIDIFNFLQNEYYHNRLPIMGQVILLFLEYNISMPQNPNWMFQYMHKFYQICLKSNILQDHLLALYILVRFNKQERLIWDMGGKYTTFLETIIQVSKKIIALLDKLITEGAQLSVYHNCLDLLQKNFYKNHYQLKFINEQIKAMNRKQDMISIEFINSKIVYLAQAHLQILIIGQYQIYREYIFPFMKLISCSFTELMQLNKNIPQIVYEFIMTFNQKSLEIQNALIHYLRPIQFIIGLLPYLKQKNVERYVKFLKKIALKANEDNYKKQFQIFELIRLRLLLHYMKIQVDPNSRLQKTYRTTKKNQILVVFQNLERTKLRDHHLPEMIEICQDILKNKSIEFNDQTDDNVTWSIMISSIKPQEMLLLWRPYIKKSIKSSKFLMFLNACISEQNFEISGFDLQLMGQIFLQCQQRELFHKSNIEKLLKFSHPYEMFHQLWDNSIHNIKFVFTVYHICQTHKYFLSHEPVTFFDFVKKQIYFLNNLTRLPQYQFTISESVAVLCYFIQEKLVQQKQLDSTIIGLYKDLFLCIASNNLTWIIVQDLKKNPLKMINLNKYLCELCIKSCSNNYDKLSLIKISESLDLEQIGKNPQIVQSNDQQFEKLKILSQKQLSQKQLQAYPPENLISFVFRGIYSPNHDLICEQISKFLQAQEQFIYSINTLNLLAKMLYQKFYLGNKMTKSQRQLATTIANCYKKYFLISELPFRAKFALASMHTINNQSLPAQFPIQNFIGGNRYVIMELAPLINHNHIQVTESKIEQLIKYISFSRMFQFYFNINIQIVLKKGIDKLSELLIMILLNGKPEKVIKIIEIVIKDLKKMSPQLCAYLSKKLALWYYTINNSQGRKLQDTLYGLSQLLIQDQMHTQIRTIINKNNQIQNTLTERIQKQNKLIHSKLKLYLNQANIELDAYINEQQNYVLVRDKSQLIDGVRPCGRDVLFAKFLQENLRVKISFIGCCLQSV